MIRGSADNLVDYESSRIARITSLVETVALGIFLASCDARHTASCTKHTSCYAVGSVYVVGAPEDQKLSIAEALKNAARSYRTWAMAEPPPGLILFDKSVRLSDSISGRAGWKFSYDTKRDPHYNFGRASHSSEAPLTGEAGQPGTSLDSSVLAHEVCHKYAQYLFSETRSSSNKLPDAVNEIAAVSCESADRKRERLKEFRGLYKQGRHVAWGAFLSSSHPLKDTLLLTKIKSFGTAAKSNHMTFTFDRNSGLGSKVEAFYGQSAAVATFLESRNCADASAVGRLIKEYDAKLGLGPWLARASCLPRNVAEFNSEMDVHIMRNPDSD